MTITIDFTIAVRAFLIGVLGLIVLYVPFNAFIANRPLAVLLMITYAAFIATALVFDINDGTL